MNECQGGEGAWPSGKVPELAKEVLEPFEGLLTLGKRLERLEEAVVPVVLVGKGVVPPEVIVPSEIKLLPETGLLPAEVPPLAVPGVPAPVPSVPAAVPGVPALVPGVPAPMPGVPAPEPEVPAAVPGVPAPVPGVPAAVPGAAVVDVVLAGDAPEDTP